MEKVLNLKHNISILLVLILIGFLIYNNSSGSSENININDEYITDIEIELHDEEESTQIHEILKPNQRIFCLIVTSRKTLNTLVN